MRRKYLASLFVALALVGLWGFENANSAGIASEDYKRNHPSALQTSVFLRDIAPDNKTLLVQYGSPYWSKIVTYDVATGKVHFFTDDKNKMDDAPYFSNDGKMIVYIGYRERDYAGNIYVMNVDGSNLRQITKHPEAKIENIYAHAPSFSPDSKRIIFIRSHINRERAFPLRGGMHSAWDVYEVEIESGKERRLTNYNFYEASWPYYMADGKRFIFSGEGPYNPTGTGPKDFKEYEMMYHKNFIFIMDGQNDELKPAFTNWHYSYRPHVSRDDTIVFISKTAAMDGIYTRDTQDLFLYKKRKITRLTKLNSYITWAKFSHDGKYIFFQKKSDKRNIDDSYWIMKSDGTELKEIKIPMDVLKQ